MFGVLEDEDVHQNDATPNRECISKKHIPTGIKLNQEVLEVFRFALDFMCGPGLHPLRVIRHSRRLFTQLALNP